MNEFANEQWIQYESGATFVRRCEKCMRFVSPDETIRGNESGIKDEHNATCKVHGRTKMIFVGYI